MRDILFSKVNIYLIFRLYNKGTYYKRKYKLSWKDQRKDGCGGSILLGKLKNRLKIGISLDS